jgi:hypothetical protein
LSSARRICRAACAVWKFLAGRELNGYPKGSSPHRGLFFAASGFSSGGFLDFSTREGLMRG